MRPDIRGQFAFEAEVETAFFSALWSLVRDGIIVPRAPALTYQTQYLEAGTLAFSNLSVTPFGRQLLLSPDTVTPNDGSAYIADAKAQIGDADETILAYLSEAQQSFEHRLYLSATVMLGVSAEMLMKWLIQKFLAHLPERKFAEISGKLQQLRNRTDKLLETFLSALQPHLFEFDKDVRYQVEAYLENLQLLIRVNRDDVGHGRAKRADSQLVCGNLISYLTLLGLARELADSLSSTPCSIFREGSTV